MAALKLAIKDLVLASVGWQGKRKEDEKNWPGMTVSDEHGVPRLTPHKERRKEAAKKGSPQSALDERSTGRCGKT